jgi:hypothetical protein
MLIMVIGCSGDAPLSPAASTAQALTAPNAPQTPSSQIATAGLDSGPADESSTYVEFDVLLLTPDLENNTIQLFDMVSTMLIGHVNENTVLLGMDGEEVTLADFMVCFRGHAKGNITNPGEIELEFLQMLPF